MIHYQLQCQGDHVFDGWFNDSASFDRQAEARLIACPLCSSVEIRRALMAPALARGKRKGRNHAPSEDTAPARAPAEPNGVAPAVSSAVGALALPDMPEKLRSVLQQLRSEVEKHCDYVGTDFAEEARRIHYGETQVRGIYGETTPSEAEALADEGIEFGVMPWLRRSDS
jgi:hypothetical protein